jgi:phosphopantothenoylcysteine decarboxylase/phosphopantothenate--cysteine ligase
VKTRRVQTALEMLAAVEAELPADVFVGVAAVADWRPAESAAQKLKTDKAQVASLSLTENPDILRTVAGLKSNRPRLVVGFAAETHDVERHAREKLARKGCDWIVANDVSGGAMGGADNEVALVTRQGVDAWPKADKADIARRLAQRIAESLDAPRDERRAE